MIFLGKMVKYKGEEIEKMRERLYNQPQDNM